MKLQFRIIWSNIIAVLEFLTPIYNQRKTENLEKDENVILKMKGSSSAYSINDSLNYISPLKVFNDSVCVKVSLIFSEIKEKTLFSKRCTLHWDTLYIDITSCTCIESQYFGRCTIPFLVR